MEWRRPAAVTEGNDSLVTDGDGSAVARGGARGGRVRGGGMAASGRPGGQQQVNSTSTKHQAPSTKHQQQLRAAGSPSNPISVLTRGGRRLCYWAGEGLKYPGAVRRTHVMGLAGGGDRAAH